MVVPVLITNCQVSEKPKNSPLMAHTIISTKAIADAIGLPEALVIALEILLKTK